MSTNIQPPLPPDRDAAFGGADDEPVIEVDGEEILDPDANDEQIDSADADRLASGGETA